MKTLKRIFAFLSAVLLILLYAASLVFSLLGTPAASDLLKVSIAATIILPVLLYALTLFVRLSDPEEDNPDDD